MNEWTNGVEQDLLSLYTMGEIPHHLDASKQEENPL